MAMVKIMTLRDWGWMEVIILGPRFGNHRRVWKERDHSAVWRP